MAEDDDEISIEEPDDETTELDDDEEQEEVVEYDEDAPNIVPALLSTDKGKEALKKIADMVYSEVHAAWDASESRRMRNAEDWKLFSGDLPQKTVPFKDCANLHVPIYMENAVRLVTRMYGELFGDGTEVIGVQPVGPDDREVADVLTRHGNWQLATELTDFPREMERGLLFFVGPGDVVCHSYYDPSRRKNKHEVLSTDEVIVPYAMTSTEPDFSDCPWVAKWLHRYKHQMQRMRDEWHDVDSVIEGRKASWDDEPESPLRDENDDRTGLEKDDAVRAPYKLIYFEGWLELPEQVDERFCKLVMDDATKTVLQLQIFEEDDWKDRVRFERQSAELDQFRMAHQEWMMAMSMPPPEPMLGGIDPMTGMPMMAPPPPPPPPEPPPPEWAGEDALLPDFAPATARRVPIHMFQHAVCIEPVVGPIGMGYGRIWSDQNVAANIGINQFVDQATLGNGSTFLAAGGLGAKKGESIEIVPGRVNPIPDITPNELKDALMKLDFGPANPQLVELVRMLQQWGQAVAQTPSVLSGDPGKSGETFRGISARIEQATKQISVTTQKYGRFVTGVVRNNARLNAQFLPEEELVYVNDHKTGSVQELNIRRDMYDRDYRVILRADMRFATQAARVSEADQLVQMPAAVPAMQGDTAFHHAAVTEALKARGMDHLLPMIGPPPPVPETPFGLPPPPPPGMVPPGAAPPGGPPPPQGAPMMGVPPEGPPQPAG